MTVRDLFSEGDQQRELVIIAALAKKNRVIGDGMDLPWHIPEDLKHFKRLTLGKPLLMGRVTFEAILSQFGGPLPGRRHVVLTRNPEAVEHQSAECYTDIESSLEALSDEPIVFIAGGAQIYAQTIEIADRMELTLIEGDHTGDAYFPEYQHLIGERYYLSRNEQHDGFCFQTYKKM